MLLFGRNGVGLHGSGGVGGGARVGGEGLFDDEVVAGFNVARWQSEVGGEFSVGLLPLSAVLKITLETGFVNRICGLRPAGE